MLDQETEQIIALLISRTIGPGDHQTLQDTLDADIPPGVKTFLAAEILHRLREKLEPSGTISSSPEAFQLKERSLRQSALRHQFSREDFIVAMENAVHFLVNYLCRPQWTLKEFLLDGRETVSREALVSKLSFLQDYPYYRILISKILQAKGWSSITSDQLQSLLSSIDLQYHKGLNGNEIASLASPLFSLLSLRSDPPSHRLPYKALLVYLADKSMQSTGDYLEKVCRVRNTSEISMQEFAGILQDMPEGYEPPPVEIPAPSSPPTAGEQEDRPPEDPARPETVDKSAGTDPELPPQKRNIALSLTFAGLREKPVASPRASVNSLISPDLRTLFVKELFSNDPAYYGAIVATLDATTEWKDAEAYMSRFCEINELDPETHEVAQFMDIVRQRFMTESPGNA